MKQPILRISYCIVAFLLFTSMANPTTTVINPKTQKEFNDFFAKRSFLYRNQSELERMYKTKFNFLQQFKIKQAKKKISRQLHKENLLEGCDTIKLKNGEEISAVVSEIDSTNIKYKKCDNRNGPSYSIKKSDIQMIAYANGSKDYFGNEKPAGVDKDAVVNSAAAKTDPLAIISLVTVVLGFSLGLLLASPGLLLLIPVGIILGFVSLSRIKKSKGRLKGKGLAGAGIISGFTFILIIIIALALYAGGW